MNVGSNLNPSAIMTQRRQTEINNYYTQYYRYLTSLFYRYSGFLVVLIILVIFWNAGVMTDTIFGIFFIPIMAYMIIEIIYNVYSFSRRNNNNFDYINWSFNPAANGSSTNIGTGTGSSSGLSCTNQACCGSGQTWNGSIGKCVIIQ